MFMAECPVKMLITDPDGLRIGYDPSSNQTINEIPYATYYPGNETRPEIIMIPYKKNGNYTVKIFGTQDGEYNLTCISLNQTGHISIWNITNIPVSKDEYQTYIIPEYPPTKILLSAILITTTMMVLIRKKHKQQQLLKYYRSEIIINNVHFQMSKCLGKRLSKLFLALKKANFSLFT